LQRFRLEQEGGGETEFEMELPLDGSNSPNLIAKPRMKLTREARRPDSMDTPEIKNVIPPSASLTKNDLAILKRIPRSQHPPKPTPNT
jgi:hypothetical protein